MTKLIGFTLLELLLALALGAFLLTGLIQAAASMRETQRLQEALVTIQENGRFIIYLLNHSVRMAGYNACQTDNSSNITEAIHGYNSAQLPPWLRQTRIVPDSDVVVIDKCNHLTAYFIADTARKNATGTDITGLYQKEMNNGESQPSQEIAPNVEEMKIQYGLSEPQGKDILNYFSAHQLTAAQWQHVRSVQISWLLTSTDNVLTKPQIINFATKQTTAPDRRLYKEWDTYIALRERLSH